jgi:hypothetical protein
MQGDLPSDRGQERDASVDMPVATADGGLARTPEDASASDIEDDVVLWRGGDAEIFVGAPVDAREGGLHPPVFVLPASFVVSHSPMFGTEPDLTARLQGAYDPLLVDLDGDGLLDVVLSDGGKSLSCFAQSKAGAFRALHGIDMGPRYRFDLVKVADVNADGLGDIVLVRYPDENGWYHAELAVHWQRSEGFRDEPDVRMAFLPAASDDSSTCVRTYALSIDDMDGDGRPDILALSAVAQRTSISCSYSQGFAQIFTQAADGSFSATTTLSPRSSPSTCVICAVELVTGDLDNDGRKDLVILQDAAGAGAGIPLHGHEVLVYPRDAEGFGDAPSQVLKMNQFLRFVELADVNRDGRLDILVRPGEWDQSAGTVDLSSTVPGLSGAFLQTADGTFDAARALVLDDPPADGWASKATRPQTTTWMPKDTNTKSDPLGIAVRDLDGDGDADLVVERKSAPEGLFHQWSGLFATRPDLEVQSLFPDLLAVAKKSTLITFSETSNSKSIGYCDNRLATRVADMDGDGMDDVVAAYAPCAPNQTPDPVTGWYSPDGFKANTYTDLRIHRQRVPARRLAVEIQESKVMLPEGLLKIRATVRNLSQQPAAGVHVRVQAAEAPFIFSYTLDMLANEYEKLADYARESIMKSEAQIKGSRLGPDILIPQIGPGETIPLSISIPVALTRYLETYALFVLVDPEQNTNLLYRRRFDFIH